MWKKVAFLAVILAGFGLAASARAQDVDPSGRHPVLRCARVANHKAHRTVRMMRHQARHCARAITILKAQGNDDQAAAVAEQCEAGINEKAAAGTSAVEELISTCVAALNEHGAPEEIVAALTAHGQRLVQRIDVVRMNLIERIDAVLVGESNDGEGE